MPYVNGLVSGRRVLGLKSTSAVAGHVTINKSAQYPEIAMREINLSTTLLLPPPDDYPSSSTDTAHCLNWI